MNNAAIFADPTQSQDSLLIELEYLANAVQDGDFRVIWGGTLDNCTIPTHLLKSGDGIFTQSLSLFGTNPIEVKATLEELVFNQGVRVFFPTGFGMTEITQEALEVAVCISEFHAGARSSEAS